MSATNILLAANQPQGVSLNASQMLGLGAGGSELQDQLQKQIEDRRKDILPDKASAVQALFGTAK